eukprot:5377321-Prymnesium_polylepis.1
MPVRVAALAEGAKGGGDAEARFDIFRKIQTYFPKNTAREMAMYDEDSMTGLSTALVVLRKLDKDISTLGGGATDEEDAYKMLTDKQFTACGGIRVGSLGRRRRDKRRAARMARVCGGGDVAGG